MRHENEPQGWVKRIFDVVLSLSLMIVLSPLLLIIALAIRISTGSPVLYEWKVIGMNGNPLISWKFRTMHRGAEEHKVRLAQWNEMRGPLFKMRDDPRVTPIGKILRKFSLDELPQLWSVLKGDMSLVGPRPVLPIEYARFSDQQKRKLAIKPGMTSLWHVRGRPRDFDEWVQLDLEYIENWSLELDLKILIRTALIVLMGKNY